MGMSPTVSWVRPSQATAWARLYVVLFHVLIEVTSTVDMNFIGQNWHLEYNHVATVKVILESSFETL